VHNFIFVETSGRRYLATRGRDLRDRPKVFFAEKNDALGTPVAAIAMNIVGKGLGVSSGDADRFQFSIGDEGEVVAVGRPEGHGGVFGAGKHRGLLGVKRAEPEVGAALVIDGGEGQRLAVGRDDDWARVKAGSAKCSLRRGWDVGAY
jgi:hypothetical protein